jgi:replicative DNA helicase
VRRCNSDVETGERLVTTTAALAVSAPTGFSAEFQRAMLRLMMDDEGFCDVCMKYLQGRYFENGALAWVFGLIAEYHKSYARPPSSFVIQEQIRRMSADQQSAVWPTVYAIISQPCADPEYVSSRVVEFVKRNLIVEGVQHLRTLYNGNKLDDCIAFFEERSTQIASISLSAPDRSFFFEELEQRQLRRKADAAQEHLNTFSTGIKDLDRVLDGGLHRGELGIWVGYPKTGKSMMLRWLAFFAVRALRIPVLYFVLEGGREQTEDSLETAFALERAQLIRRGQMDGAKEALLQAEYRELKHLLVLRGYTKDENTWNASVLDFTAELRELKQKHGFVPRLIIVDYGDLMGAREKGRDMSTTEIQKSAFRDLKSLCGRDKGYALWTASQAQRPGNGADTNEQHVLKAHKIADSYEKVRAADFIGSVNRTIGESEREAARIYAELYRSAPAGRLISIKTDYAHGKMFTSVQSSSPLAVHEQQQLEI